MNSLNTEILIAKRMLKKQGKTNKFSQPIVILAIIGITLGICVMILAMSVATGFQKEVRDKVVGFGSHIQIEPQSNNESFDSSPMVIEDELMTQILQNSKVRHAQYYAYKPAIIQTKRKDVKNKKGEIIRDIEAIVFKGIGPDFDEGFFNKHIISGKFPNYSSNNRNDSIVISNYFAKRLRLKPNDTISALFFNQNGDQIETKPSLRPLYISGIYETGLENVDEKFAFMDLNKLKKINGWFINVNLELKRNINDTTYYIKANPSGGNHNYIYCWNNSNSFTKNNNLNIDLNSFIDTTIQLVCTDYFNDPNTYLQSNKLPVIPNNINDLMVWKRARMSIPDTAWLSLSKDSANNLIDTLIKTKGIDGSSKYYTGGIEVFLNKYDALLNTVDEIKGLIKADDFKTSTIKEKYEMIFNWLNMLDVNVYIILSLMILVAVINMTAALLVIILEKTQLIGILKSLGTTNWSVRKIFIYHGSYLILYGIILGNILAISIIILQNQYEILTLPQENYFVSIVPMHFPIIPFILINICSFSICILSLIIPSYLITKISPIKAIRLE